MSVVLAYMFLLNQQDLSPVQRAGLCGKQAPLLGSSTNLVMAIDLKQVGTIIINYNLLPKLAGHPSSFSVPFGC